MTTITLEEFASFISKNKNGWINGTFNVDGKIVGIKAYNKWIQRIEFDGFVDSSPEFKTQKDAKNWILKTLS